MKTNIDFACIVEHLEATKTLFKHINNAAVMDSLIRLKPLLEDAKLEEHEALQVAINLDNLITDCSKRSDIDHSIESSSYLYVIKVLRAEQYRYYIMGGHANGAFNPDPFHIKREDILRFKTEQQWNDYCENINYEVACAAAMDDLYFLRSSLQHFVDSNLELNTRTIRGVISNLNYAIREREKAHDN